jgi:hypothetical protein
MAQLASKLTEVFERVYLHGVAPIARIDLLFWHGSERTKVTKKMFNEIEAAWKEWCKEMYEFKASDVPKLLCGYNPYTLTYVFVFGGFRDEKTKDVISWLRDVDTFPSASDEVAE